MECRHSDGEVPFGLITLQEPINFATHTQYQNTMETNRNRALPTPLYQADLNGWLINLVARIHSWNLSSSLQVIAI